MTDKIKIGYLGVGSYVPENVLTNAHLESIVDTTAEWIIQRTGIHTRRIMGPEDSLATMALNASRAALDQAGIEPSQINDIRIGVNTHMRFPSLAATVQEELGADNASAADISAGCAGFIFSVEDVYNRMIAEWALHRRSYYALAIGVDALSVITDWNDRSTCVLFGDGAGAVVIGPVESGEILATVTRTQGKYAKLLYLDKFLSNSLEEPEGMNMLRRNGTVYPFLRMAGPKVFPVAVRTMMADIKSVVEKYNSLGGESISLQDIEYVIPHQANLRIVRAVADGLKLGYDQVYSAGVINYGNTSAASIPLGYADEWGKRPGALQVDVAFGAGFASGAILRRESDK